jgi:hypothetical protein
LLALQATYPKAYKNIATNSFEIVVNLSMWRVIFKKFFRSEWHMGYSYLMPTKI